MTAWNSTLPLPKKPMRRKKPMNKVSKKRKSEQPRRDRWEAAVFEHDYFECQNLFCINRKHPIELDAHHIWEKGSRPEWRFILENGITLCRVCHELVHAKQIELPVDRAALKSEFMRGVGKVIE